MLLALKLPALNGLEAYLAIREFRPNVVAIVITGYRQEMSELVQRALQESACTCLEKPKNMDELLAQIEEQRNKGTLKKPQWRLLRAGGGSFMERKFQMLVADDDVNLASNLADILEAEGYSAVVAHDGQTALNLSDKKVFDLALIDIRLPDMPGAELIRRLAELSPGVEYIIITGYASLNRAIEAASQRNIVGYLSKPLNMEHLLALIRQVTERKRAEEAVARHSRDLTALYGALLATARSLDLEEVLKEIVHQVSAALDSAYTSIVTVDEEGNLGISSEDSVGMPAPGVKPRPGGYTRRIIETGEAIVIDDAESDENTNLLLKAAGVKSYAGVPIRSKAATIGVLFVHSLQPKAFGHRVDLLAAFANQAAIAIENARLYREASTAGALREADRLKTELLANVSHELRTPLTSIKGYSTTMLRHYEKIGDDEKRQYLEEISQASDKLKELIENLLQLSKLEAGGLPLKREPTDITCLIDKAVKDMQQKAEKHHLASQLADSPVVAEVDPRRIRQVVDNLLDNAVKFSPEGTDISVRCELKDSELMVSVQDQGPGISSHELERVFERFYQASPRVFHKERGAGLGLSICRRIVEAHGGRIWVKSELGQGSTFMLTLPRLAQQSEGGG